MASQSPCVQRHITALTLFSAEYRFCIKIAQYGDLDFPMCASQSDLKSINNINLLGGLADVLAVLIQLSWVWKPIPSLDVVRNVPFVTLR